MRFVLVFLLCVHAVIHLVGVAREWHIGSAPALSDAVSRTSPAIASRLGALWLTACVALLAGAVLLLARDERWWMLSAVGIGISQLLILSQWQEAKAGTLPNLVLAIAVVIAYAGSRFAADGDALIAKLLAQAARVPATRVQPSELDPLPPIVQTWLRGAGVIGRERATSVRLRQRGELRTAPDQAFMPATADQYFSIFEPGFVWRVSVPMFHIPIAGRDTYIDGKGRMLIKALSIVPIVDGQGPSIDQGTLLRFLGEMVWFPSAALAPYVYWEAIDAQRARATMSFGGITAAADFAFDASGRVLEMQAQRYLKSGDAEPTLERWVVKNHAWQTMDGELIPTRGEVSWKLPAGDFTYYKWELTELQRNLPKPYAAR